METNKKVCVVVPVFNRLECTKRFVESFTQSTYKNYTILIFDDGSTDGTSEYLAKHHPEIVVLKGDGSYWWSGSTNEGVKYALHNNYDYILTINNDATVDKDLLKNLVSCAEENPHSIVGSRVMLGSSGKVFSLGETVCCSFSRLTITNNKADESVVEQSKNPLQADALTGNGVLVPVEVFKAIGMYDSKWCPQYYGDVEFTYRATINGFRCLVDLDAIVYNNELAENPHFSFIDELLSKKSGRYWRPFIKLYLVHAPLRYKMFILARYAWIPKRIIMMMLRKS